MSFTVLSSSSVGKRSIEVSDAPRRMRARSEPPIESQSGSQDVIKKRRICAKKPYERPFRIDMTSVRSPQKKDCENEGQGVYNIIRGRLRERRVMPRRRARGLKRSRTENDTLDGSTNKAISSQDTSQAHTNTQSTVRSSWHQHPSERRQEEGLVFLVNRRLAIAPRVDGLDSISEVED